VSVSRAGSPAGADPLGLPVIPSPCKAWSGSTPTVGRGQSDGTTTPPQMGVMTCTTRADRCLGFMPPAGGCGRRAAPRTPGRQAHGRQRPRQWCGRGVRRPARGPAQAGVGADPLYRLHRCPAGQPGALLGDAATMEVGVGLVMAGRHPDPAGQLGGTGEAGDLADLGDQHPCQHRPEPVDRLDRPVAGVAGQPCASHPTNRSISASSTWISRRSELTRAAKVLGSCRWSSSSVPASPNRSLMRTGMPQAARTAWT
jgi:hypothetical protein